VDLQEDVADAQGRALVMGDDDLDRQSRPESTRPRERPGRPRLGRRSGVSVGGIQSLPMEIGHLPDLFVRVGSIGGSVAIRPVFEKPPGRYLLSAPIEGTPDTVLSLVGWEIRCSTPT